MKYLSLILLLFSITVLSALSKDFDKAVSSKNLLKNPYVKNENPFITLQDTSVWSPEKDVSKLNKKFGKSSSGSGFKGGIGAGVGIGLPYGVIGARLYGDISYIQGSFGLGVFPLLWEPVYALSGSIFFNKPDRNFRPKMTLCLANISQAIVFLDENLELLYSESHPGGAIYFGADIKPFSFISFDINFGYLWGKLNNDEFTNRYNEKKSYYESIGYTFNELTPPKGNGFKLSLGAALYLGI
ncbi:MAG: hypothetical protein JXB17_00170 [Bacteroidales bacterium]|nr:hypothetical protein [Bacteroidales bacterium]